MSCLRLTLSRARKAIEHRDQISVAISVDAERLFLSGGTISKLRNQLSEDPAHAAIMVDQWGGDPDLIAAEEPEKQLADGWIRKKE
jgi:hypothetical protein